MVIEVLNPTSEEVALVEVRSEGCFVNPGGHSMGEEPLFDIEDHGHGWSQRGQRDFANPTWNIWNINFFLWRPTDTPRQKSRTRHFVMKLIGSIQR